MSYHGETFVIPFVQGGINYNKDSDSLNQIDFSEDSENITFHRGLCENRGGSHKLYDGAHSGTPEVVGLGQLNEVSGNSTVLSATADGKIYRDKTNTVKTGLTINSRTTMFSCNDKMFVCNGSNKPQVWNLTIGTARDITTSPSDWTSGGPKKGVVHELGAQTRTVFFGCADTPYTLYISSATDEEDVGDVNGYTISFRIEDSPGIVDVISKSNRLFVFGAHKTYVVEDADADPNNWGYSPATFKSGCGGVDLAISIPNDIVVMAPDGIIYSFRDAYEKDNYIQASLIKETYIDIWLKENINFNKIDNFHARHNRKLKVIQYFLTSKNSLVNDVSLLYFYERPPREAFMIHRNSLYDSGYDARSSAEVKDSDNIWTVYTGDYSGNVWTLDDENTKTDEGSPYFFKAETPLLNFEDSRSLKAFQSCHVISLLQEHDYILDVSFRVDRNITITDSLTYASGGDKIGTAKVGTATIGKGNQLVTQSMQLKDKGTRGKLSVSNNETGKNIQLSRAMIDRKVLSNLPEVA